MAAAARAAARAVVRAGAARAVVRAAVRAAVRAEEMVVAGSVAVPAEGSVAEAKVAAI